MSKDTRTSVQRAYDEAVNAEGYPTDRAQDLLRGHDGLVIELYEAAVWLDATNDDLDPVDVFLAGFTAALIWNENQEAA